MNKQELNNKINEFLQDFSCSIEWLEIAKYTIDSVLLDIKYNLDSDEDKKDYKELEEISKKIDEIIERNI